MKQFQSPAIISYLNKKTETGRTDGKDEWYNVTSNAAYYQIWLTF